MRKKLFIFEMANNHMGSVEHGLKLIEEFAAVKDQYPEFDFAIKFQFRNIDTFIHPDYKDRMDLKYVKRFTETRLTLEQFQRLKCCAEDRGFKTVCTAFDEDSITAIEDMGFPIIKIASCSLTDWPLLNRIAKTDVPIIASTAGGTLEEIDNVVSFFTNRNKDLTIMHCVGEYPTITTNLQLNQISLLREKYPNITIGYSTHEDPDNPDIVPIAIAKGATVFEKHVAVVTDEFPKNDYSATPEQVSRWLAKARTAFQICGQTTGRLDASDKELSDLRRFKRGVFANRNITKGEVITRDDVFYAFPCQGDQVLANDMSKYTQFTADRDFIKNAPIQGTEVRTQNIRDKVYNIVQDVKTFLNEANVVFPPEADLEISHHYGIDKFYQVGITMITVVNRDYCKKLIIVLPGQEHPEQFHKVKEETFVLLYGAVDLYLDDELVNLSRGGVVTIAPGVRHRFETKTGCVIEEVSSTHYKSDSYYVDPEIAKNQNRKTFIPYWVS
jgi:sialic acid synthase SpsE/mannose-6-phosphate isomerase-like protein (cupin superfamily)